MAEDEWDEWGRRKQRSRASGLKRTRHLGIMQRTNADGTVSYVYKYHRVGRPQKQYTYKASGKDGPAKQRALEDAIACRNRFQDAHRERHLTPSFARLDGIKVWKICNEYIEDHMEPLWDFSKGIMPVRNESVYNRRVVLLEFMKDELAKVSLADFNDNGPGLIEEYFNRCKVRPVHGNGWKKDKPIELSTIRREFNILQRVFAKAAFKYKGLTNHFKGYRIPGSMRRYKGRVAQSYIERLYAACNECLGRNKEYVPLVIAIGAYTGMSLSEVFNLTWKDIDIPKRRIQIKGGRSKIRNQVGIKIIAMSEDGEDEIQPRTLVISLPLMAYLTARIHLFVGIGWINNSSDAEGKVFPMTKEAFKQTFRDVRIRAGLKGITFRHLRREAATRFHEAGLDENEVALMLMHTKETITMSYIDDEVKLKIIQDKLDRYMTGGRTLEEIERHMLSGGWKPTKEDIEKFKNIVKKYHEPIKDSEVPKPEEVKPESRSMVIHHT
jgi:integrase